MSKFIIGFVFYLPALFFRGWVLSRLYLWFVVPTFHVNPISPGMAYGIAILLGLATFDTSNIKRGSRTDWAWTISLMWVAPAFSLLFGCIVQKWLL